MTQCARCGSYAVNHHKHGRDGSDGHLCDVCYWRTRAEASATDAARYRWLATRCRSTAEHGGGRWSIVVDGPAPVRDDCKDALDAAVDAAMRAGAPSTPPSTRKRTPCVDQPADRGATTMRITGKEFNDFCVSS